MELKTKVCNRCKIEKPLALFPHRGAERFDSICTSCNNEKKKLKKSGDKSWKGYSFKI